jgi:hypothetical protein
MFLSSQCSVPVGGSSKALELTTGALVEFATENFLKSRRRHRHRAPDEPRGRTQDAGRGPGHDLYAHGLPARGCHALRAAWRPLRGDKRFCCVLNRFVPRRTSLNARTRSVVLLLFAVCCSLFAARAGGGGGGGAGCWVLSTACGLLVSARAAAQLLAALHSLHHAQLPIQALTRLAVCTTLEDETGRPWVPWRRPLRARAPLPRSAARTRAAVSWSPLGRRVACCLTSLRPHGFTFICAVRSKAACCAVVRHPHPRYAIRAPRADSASIRRADAGDNIEPIEHEIRVLETSEAG